MTELHVNPFFRDRAVIKADDLKGPRVYSTDLLPSLLDISRVEESILVTARALKIKIITKGLVTLNCAYLLSPLAIHLFDRYPDILSGSAILPAFRADKESLEDLVTSVENMEAAGIDQNRLREHISRVDHLVKQIMPWDLGTTGEQYQTLMLTDLRNHSSTIVRVLTSRGNCTIADIERIARDIETHDFNDSRNIRNYIARLAEPTRTLLNRFTTACYHSVGTRVVKCETGTDLNPLSQFKAADFVLTARDASSAALTDEAVFLRAFMGFALSAIQAAVLPAHIIDALDFKSAHDLSSALRKSGFQDKYDGIVRQYLTSSGLSDTHDALESVEEQAVADVAKGLAEEFRAAILDELPNYTTRIQADTQKSLYAVGTDIIHDAIAGIPALSNIVAFTDAVGHVYQGTKAAAELLSMRDPEKALIKARERRAEEIRKAVETLRVEGKKRSKLLDAIALLTDVHRISIARA